MGLRNLWARLRGKSVSAMSVGDFAGGLFSTTYRNPPKRGTKELIAAYNAWPWLRAVTGKISRDVAAVPFRLYAASATPDATARAWRPGVDRAEHQVTTAFADREGRRKALASLRSQGRLREFTAHPLLDFLCKPNDRMTGMGARRIEQVWLDIKGEGFRLLQTTPEGMPTGYLPIPPHWVLELPLPGVPFYRVAIQGRNFMVPEANMLHLRELDPVNPFGRGTGVGEALGDELETDEFAAKYIKAFFYNMAVPEFLVSVEGASTTELKKLKEDWSAEHRGGWNRFKTRFLTGKMNAVRMDSTFKDQQIVELRKHQHDFIRQTFGVPPEVLGVLENSNRATIDAASYLYAHGVLVPRLEFQRLELQTWLIPRFDSNLILDYDDPTPENRAFTLDVVKSSPYAFSLNEIRELAEHEPVPEFEGVYPPLAMPGQAPTSGADAPDATEEPSANMPPADDDGDVKRRDPPWARRLAGQSRPVLDRS